MKRCGILQSLLVVAVALGFAACESTQGPLGPTDLSSAPGGDLVFAKGNGNSDDNGNGKNNGKDNGPKDGGNDDTQTEQITYAAKTIGKNGGFLSITDAKFLVPKNALASRTRITMENVGAIEGGLWAYEFTPAGLVFDKPAELWVDVSLEFLEANGIDPGRLRIALVTGPNPANWQYLNGRYQPAYQHINVQIEHFSRYALCIE
jgi:hypothetical protein